MQTVLQNPLRSRLYGTLMIFDFLFLFKIGSIFGCSNWKLQFQLESLKGCFDVDADAEKIMVAPYLNLLMPKIHNFGKIGKKIRF